MRIITGSARGTRLQTLEGDSTRPTSERAKEGIFSAIQFKIPGRRVLDLFCGCGQLALEALSRGAEFAVMVDAERRATEIARDNAVKTKLMKQSRIVTADYKEFLSSSKEKFDLVFLDPPYSPGVLDDVLQRLLKNSLLSDDALVVCESAADGIPASIGFSSSKTYKYGKTIVTILVFEDSNSDDTD